MNLFYSCEPSGGAEVLLLVPGVIRDHPSLSPEVSLLTLIMGLETACFSNVDGGLASSEMDLRDDPVYLLFVFASAEQPDHFFL